MPLALATASPVLDPAAWRAAQGAQAPALAWAAMAVGRLDAAAARPGAVARLARLEVEALLWAAGTPLRREDIGRPPAALRADADLAAQRLARWAVRRLEGEGDPDDLRGFLGLHRSAAPGRAAALAPRATGAEFDAAAAAFTAAMAALPDAHPITRGAYARLVWRLAELSPAEDVVEAATWSARRMAEGCAALPFVPLGSFGRRLWRGAAPVETRLADHYRAVTDGATAARLMLERLAGWAARARAATAAIKGDNPARVIAVLEARPLATTESVETAAGISRDTAERLLRRLTALGIAREVTGARRFRLWTAAV